MVAGQINRRPPVVNPERHPARCGGRTGGWNKHLQPSSYRLLDTRDQAGRNISLNVTIKLEDMSTFPDSPPIFKRMRKYFEEHLRK